MIQREEATRVLDASNIGVFIRSGRAGGPFTNVNRDVCGRRNMSRRAEVLRELFSFCVKE